MGSVGDDYVCPWCGRVGNGGHAPDGIDWPICTEGEHSCLSQVCDNGIQTVSQFRSEQLRAILRPWIRATDDDTPRGPHVAAMRVPGILCAVADFLAYRRRA